MVKADLHNHLRTSSSFRDADFNRAVDLTRKKLGSGAVLGMINFADDRYEDLVSRPGYERQNIGNAVYVPDKEVLIVKGQEIPTQQGHLLVLGIEQNKHLKSGRPIEDTIKEAKDNDGTIIADHPFHIEGIGNYLVRHPELMRDIDALEVVNGEAYFGLPFTPLPVDANSKAIEFYQRTRTSWPHLGNVVSSDGHSFYEIGRAYTHITLPNIGDSEALANTLRESVRCASVLTSKANKLVGIIGAMDHIVDLIAIIGLSKLGIKKPFETREAYRFKE